jgi:hypothetical protein
MGFAFETLPSGEDGVSKCKEAPNEALPRLEGWIRLDALRARGATPLSSFLRKGSKPFGQDRISRAWYTRTRSGPSFLRRMRLMRIG